MKNFVLSIVLLSSAHMAFAAEEAQQAPATESKTSAPEAKDKKGDIDEEITNARLRATTGAKTKWSFSSGFNYYGASIVDPLNSNRPKTNFVQVGSDPQRITGDLAIKYRINEHDALNFGFGVQTAAPTKTNPAQTTASSPGVDFAHLQKFGTVQSVTDVAISKDTLKEDVEDNKLNWEFAFVQQVMMPVGQSKLEVGAVFQWTHPFYSGDLPEGNDGRTFNQYLFAPMAEYALSDKYSLRTLYRWLSYDELDGAKGKLILRPMVQSFGVGISVTRDIWLYPNMQWRWDTIRADQTTIGLQAAINL